MNVLVINGPNLARLDIRDSAIYGDMTYPQLAAHIKEAADTHGFTADVRQSDMRPQSFRGFTKPPIRNYL